ARRTLALPRLPAVLAGEHGLGVRHGGHAPGAAAGGDADAGRLRVPNRPDRLRRGSAAAGARAGRRGLGRPAPPAAAAAGDRSAAGADPAGGAGGVVVGRPVGAAPGRGRARDRHPDRGLRDRGPGDGRHAAGAGGLRRGQRQALRRGVGRGHRRTRIGRGAGPGGRSGPGDAGRRGVVPLVLGLPAPDAVRRAAGRRGGGRIGVGGGAGRAAGDRAQPAAAADHAGEQRPNLHRRDRLGDAGAVRRADPKPGVRYDRGRALGDRGRGLARVVGGEPGGAARWRRSGAGLRVGRHRAGDGAGRGGVRRADAGRHDVDRRLVGDHGRLAALRHQPVQPAPGGDAGTAAGAGGGGDAGRDPWRRGTGRAGRRGDRRDPRPARGDAAGGAVAGRPAADPAAIAGVRAAGDAGGAPGPRPPRRRV
ncbi:MAG: hypothetical protein AVDCRST_MAG73-19, partial [uncultured Thermomicrobiales bacterium]